MSQTPQILEVKGMTCGGCAKRVTEVIARAGGHEVRVEVAEAKARFVAETAQVEAIREALVEDGWTVGA